MSTNADLPIVLWLDPLEVLGAHEQAVLERTGVCAMRIQTLEELEKALVVQPVPHALVVRHDPLMDLQASAHEVFKRTGQKIPVICRVDKHQLGLAVAAMRQGAAFALADDDLTDGSWQSALEATRAQIKGDAVQAMARMVGRPRSRVLMPTPQPQGQRKLVYVDPISRHLLALTQKVALADVTALIEGPTGAGKEILARVLHESSVRAKGPFVGLNCAALPEQLIDDMLFGHERGAFTGAHKDMRGLFEQAHGGTLFLDEIGEMPMHLQAKLLRVLQERQITRLGSEQLVQVDVRVIAATNKDLRAAMQAREFREDLYFRISTFKLNVPPLRQRPGDVLPLVASMLIRHGGEQRHFTISEQAQKLLLAYAWPGNVRELDNVVQRAVVLCQNDCIEPQHLMFDDMSALQGADGLHESSEQANLEGSAQHGVHAHPSTAYPTHPAELDTHSVSDPQEPVHGFSHVADQIRSLPADSLHAAVKSNELQLIMAAIQSTDSRIEAARKLGISPRTLRYKLAKLKTKRQEPALGSHCTVAYAIGG